MKKTFSLLIFLIVFPAFAATEKNINPPPVAAVRPMTVTLDVKDEDVRDVLKSVQRQCAIKNLAVDPEVQGKATFFMRDVPCGKALDAVLRTFGLKSITYSSVLTAVERRP